MSLNELVKDNLGSRATARITPSAVKAHPSLKLFLFILLTFLIFSKLGVILHISLFIFTVSVLIFTGCFKAIYQKLIALYVGVYCFLFFINWIFNKNPGFWDKSYLTSNYYDFQTQFLNMFSRMPFSSTNLTSTMESPTVEHGLFWGGEVIKGCIKNGGGKCNHQAGGGCNSIALASTIEELKQVCGCSTSSENLAQCCQSSGNCVAHPLASKMKTFEVTTPSGRKIVGFAPTWYTFTLLQAVLAFNMANKLVMIIALSRALSYTTDLTAFTFAVGSFIKPLSVFRIPVKEITLIISLAIRFIPSLLLETMRIVKAQSSRGIDFKNGRFKDKASAFLSLFIPLFIISMIKSKELANAMISRAYLPKADRTNLRFYPLKNTHLVVFGFTLLFVILCYYFVISSYYFSPFGMIDPLLLLAS